MSGLEERSPKEGSLRFDRTISLGHLLTIATMIMGLTAAYSTYQVTVNDHESRIKFLERQLTITSDQMAIVWSIQRDVAVIKDRLERLPSGKQ